MVDDQCDLYGGRYYLAAKLCLCWEGITISEDSIARTPVCHPLFEGQVICDVFHRKYSFILRVV